MSSSSSSSSFAVAAVLRKYTQRRYCDYLFLLMIYTMFLVLTLTFIASFRNCFRASVVTYASGFWKALGHKESYRAAKVLAEY